MKNMSYWMDTATIPKMPAFTGEKECDVAVIGAGITGITVAFLLAQSGARVIVLEADTVCSGTTGHTTAKVTIQHGLKYQHLSLEKAFGYARANTAGLRQIEQIVKQYDISCDFACVPSYIYTRDLSMVDSIEAEMRAYDKLGFAGAIVEETALPFPIVRALRLDGQAQFHPVKYLNGLIEEIGKCGGKIYEHTMAQSIEQESPAVVHTNKGKLTADAVVLATNYPLVDMPGLFFAKLHQERSYIICAKASGLDIGGMYISAERPVNSVRMHSANGESYLLLGGFGHQTGKEDHNKDAYDSLERFLHNDFPTAHPAPTHGWSSQDCVTLDGIPYVGAISKKHDNVYVATGYAKWGMTNATAAAMMIADSITGSSRIDADTQEIFSPTRFAPGASAKNFIAQSANTIKQFSAGNISIPLGSVHDVAPGSGAVLRSGGRALAVYKDDDGNVSAFKAHCTHLNCPLEYNEEDNSFDCACHGSRFSVDGSVLEGPAKRPLERVDKDGV